MKNIKGLFLLLHLILLINYTMLAQNNKDIQYIIRYGSYAPSSHNAQMWQIEQLNDSTVKISLQNERLLPFVDPKNREAWISIGAFVENCVLAAIDFSYETKIKLEKQSIIICFKRTKNNIKQTKNLELIQNRQTIRYPFLQLNLDKFIINKLCGLSPNIKYFTKDSKEGQLIANQAYEAYKTQMCNAEKLKELANWMTFSRKEEQIKQTGITPYALGITGLKRNIFNLIFSQKSISGNIFQKGSIKSAKKQIEYCSGFFIITSEANNIPCWMNTGRILERFWITCTELQIAVHPMSQAIEEKKHYTYLKQSLNIKGEIQMILRVGRVEKTPKIKRRRIKVENMKRKY